MGVAMEWISCKISRTQILIIECLLGRVIVHHRLCKERAIFQFYRFLQVPTVDPKYNIHPLSLGQNEKTHEGAANPSSLHLVP